MPFSVKVKGHTHEPRPADNLLIHDPPTDGFPYDPKDHAAGLAWLDYISMAVARNEAIRLFEEEYEPLGREIDERANHPKVASALKKLHTVEKKINAKQIEYLKHERAANWVWRTLSSKDRQSYGLSWWFNVPPERPSLYGLWHIHFEAGDAAPRKLPLNEVPLMAAPPEQKMAYLKARMENQ